MNYPIAAFLSFALTLKMFACVDPPTPIQLTESTFENERLMVSSREIEIGNHLIHFNEKEKKLVSQGKN